MNNYQRIRDLREDSDMTQKEVAEKLFMHLTQYRRYESGEKNTTIESIYKITAGLSVSMSMLFEKIDSSDSISNENNYPFIAYDLVQTLSLDSQKKIIVILKSIVDMI